MPPTDSASTLESLDDARRSLPVGLANCVWDALAESEPGQRFDRMLTLLDCLVQHLSRLLLSEYDASDTQVDQVDQMIIKLANDNKEDRVSLGTHVGLVRECLARRPPTGRLERFGALADAAVPDRCRNSAWQLQLAMEQRKLGTPAWGVAALLTQRESQVTPRKPMTFMEFLNPLVTVRNDKAHPEAASDRTWFKLLNTRLEPAMAEILSWPPLYEILVGYEIVSVSGKSRGGAGRWTTEVNRDLAKQITPSGSSSVASEQPLDEGTAHVAIRDGLRVGSVILLVVDVARVARRRQEAAREECRRTFHATVLGAGGFDKIAVKAHNSLAARRGLPPDQVAQIREIGWDQIRAVSGLPSRLGLEDSAPAVMQSLDLRDREQLSARMSAWLKRVEELVLARVQASTAGGFRVVVAEELAEGIGIPTDVARFQLEALCAQRQVLRAVAPEVAGSSWGFFQVPPSVEIDKFKHVFADVRAVIEGTKPLVNADRIFELLGLAYDLLPDDDDLSDLDPEALRDKYSRANPAGSRAASSIIRSFPIRIDGQEIVLDSVADFYAHLFQRLGTRAEFLRSLPWTWGRVRRLAADTDKPTADRHGMTYSIPCPEDAPVVFFDANATREEVAYCAVQHLRKVGVDASLLLDPPAGMLEAGTLLDHTDPNDTDTPAFGVVVEVPRVGVQGQTMQTEQVEVSATTVPRLCAAFLRLLTQDVRERREFSHPSLDKT